MSSRKESQQATETLHEIESVLDRVASTAAQNPQTVLAILGGILLTAAIVGGVQWQGRRAEDQAGAAVAEVQAGYLQAMGASPGSVQVPEPANPEAGRQVRLEYVEKFLEVAREHSGSSAAVSALLEASVLQREADDDEASLATLRLAVDETQPGTALRGLALVGLAGALEAAGQWSEAGEAFAEAADIPTFLTRAQALADAARCFAEAGDAARALALAERVETESPDFPIPAHTAARLAELRVRENL